MSNFSLFLILGVSLLFLSLVFVNVNLPEPCPEDAKLCPDGSIVYRDPLSDCEFFECPNLDLVSYCSEGVVSVERSDDLIKTVSELVGAGFTVYSSSNITNCPLVSLGHMSDDCRDFLGLNWSVTINCSLIDSSLAFACPEDYYAFEGYLWINCSNTGFEDYCDPTLAQWVEHNCGIEVIS